MAILLLAGLIILATAGTKPMTPAQIRAANKAESRGPTSASSAIGRVLIQSLLK